MQKAAQASQHQVTDWEFNFSEGSLSTSNEIEHIAEECNLFRPPTIIFGSNHVEVRHKVKDFKIIYNAKEALKFINYEQRTQNYYKPQENPKLNGISYIPPRLQVKHAEKWKTIGLPKDIEITEVHQSSDSFFITPFKGRCEGKLRVERSSESVIPLHKLGPHNEMKFYKQGSIYEDQLDDNGLIQYEYKLRTMADGSWFALVRCYARVDDVHVMVLDTRLYWEQGWSKVARQFMVREAAWAALKAKNFDTMGGWTTNPHQSHMVYQFLDTTFVEDEYIILEN